MHLIKGTLEMSNGETATFTVSKDYGWQQWGATQPTLFDTMPIVQLIADNAYELGLLEPECEYCGGDCDEDDGCDEYNEGGNPE